MSWMFNSSQFYWGYFEYVEGHEHELHVLRKFFKGNISTLDTSKVNNMTALFAVSLFNGDISQWMIFLEYYHNALTSFNDSALDT